jgi:hypothetical protein
MRRLRQVAGGSDDAREVEPRPRGREQRPLDAAPEVLRPYERPVRVVDARAEWKLYVRPPSVGTGSETARSGTSRVPGSRRGNFDLPPRGDRNALRRSLHPGLVEQEPPLRVVLAVADAPRDEVEIAPVMVGTTGARASNARSTCCHSTVAAAGSCSWTAAARVICASIERSQNSERLPLCSEAGTNAAHLNCGGMKSPADGYAANQV